MFCNSWTQDGIEETSVNFQFVTEDAFNEKGEYKWNYEDQKVVVLGEVKNDLNAGETVDISLLFDIYTDPESVVYVNENAPAVSAFSNDIRQFHKKFKIGAVIEQNDEPVDNEYVGDFCFITTSNGYLSFGSPLKYNSAYVYLKEECTPELDELMTTFLNSELSGTDYGFNSSLASKREQQDSNTVVIVSLTCIAVLFFTVCASLINNSLNLKIREGKRQIGTLRAVGASSRILSKSYSIELARIFGYSGFAGTVLYTIIYFAVILYMKKMEYGISLIYTAWTAIILCILMYFVCSINLIIQIKKQMKNSIVDNIREL